MSDPHHPSPPLGKRLLRVTPFLWGVGFLYLLWLLSQGLGGGWAPPALTSSTSLWVIFFIGLTAGGLSCLAVQGGLLATTIARQAQADFQGKAETQGRVMPLLLFLGAKLLAYTLLGALLGTLGSFLSLSATVRGWLLIGIGLFMVVTALQMMEVHPLFRYLAWQPPKAAQRLLRQSARRTEYFTPALLGALTVLIPCGVTQAVELVALGSGSPERGALIMFAFVLGTSPLFFILGLLATRLAGAWQGALRGVAALAMVGMAFYSLVGGARLLGYEVNLPATALTTQPTPVSPSPGNEAGSIQITATPFTPAIPLSVSETRRLVEEQAHAGVATLQEEATLQEVAIQVRDWGYEPDRITLRAGIPARLILVTEDSYSCARNFVIPRLGVDLLLPESGREAVEFTPAEPGRIPFTCGMGMYGGIIEVLAADAEGIEVQRVVTPTPIPLVNVAAPGGKPGVEAGQITFMAPAADGRLQAFLVAPDGSGVRQLTDDPAGIMYPTLSPDGASLAYNSSRDRNPELYLQSLTTGEVRRLTEEPGGDYQPLFSPDGTRIAFVSDRAGDADLWVMQADGSGAAPLLTQPGDDFLGGWSPDGESLVFARQEGAFSAVWRVTLSDGKATQLTELEGRDGAPVFSPDGTRVAFHSDRGGGTLNVFTMAADGTDIQQLTTGEMDNMFPLYSPDGAWLVYGSAQREEVGIMVIPAAGGQPTLLGEAASGLPTSWVPATAPGTP